MVVSGTSMWVKELWRNLQPLPTSCNGYAGSLQSEKSKPKTAVTRKHVFRCCSYAAEPKSWPAAL